MKNCIRKFREELGMSQTELASRSNVSRVYLSTVETGKCMPSAENALAISRELGKPLEDVFIFTTGEELEIQDKKEGA